MNVFQYFLLFIVYAFFGWFLEVLNALIRQKKFINRGFLIGPYCPIYGVGGVLITLVLTRYHHDPIALFIMALVMCAVLEYLTSYLMEKIFKARWWDYSSKKFNINGRICLETMIVFGLGGCFTIYVANPLVIPIITSFNPIITNIVAITLLILFLFDLIVSFKIIANFKKAAFNFPKKDSTEEITKFVKEILAKKNIYTRRLMNAFPKVEAYIKKKKKD
ncbi:MAG: putative ABC transporter permease [Bacilli bacterium]